jgi:hypothetical protein
VKKEKYIILMADMINSQKMPQPVTQNEFQHIVAKMNEIFKKDILSPLTITLGDEFQCVLKDIKSATKIVLAIEEYCIFRNSKIFLRYVITEGEIDTKINRKIAHGMVGEGFAIARKSLQVLKKLKKRFWVLSDEGNNFKVYQELFVLLDMFYKKWKRDEGELIEWLLKEKDYKRIASHMRKTPSLIWKRKKSLEIEAYQSLKKLFLYAQ